MSSTLAAAVGAICSFAGAAHAEEMGATAVASSRAPTSETVGAADWRGVTYDGRTTASGERYDMYRLTAASPDLPLNSYARVTNLQTGESVVVRINDRAPVGSVISLSFAAAHRLDVDQAGPARVRVSWAGVAPPAAVADARDAEPALQRAAMAWPVERLASAELEAWPEGRRRLFSSRTRHAPLRVTWVEAAPTAFAGL